MTLLPDFSAIFNTKQYFYYYDLYHVTTLEEMRNKYFFRFTDVMLIEVQYLKVEIRKCHNSLEENLGIYATFILIW